MRGGVTGGGLWTCVCVCWGVHCVWSRTERVGELVVRAWRFTAAWARILPASLCSAEPSRGAIQALSASSVNTWLSRASMS